MVFAALLGLFLVNFMIFLFLAGWLREYATDCKIEVSYEGEFRMERFEVSTVALVIEFVVLEVKSC